MADLRTLCIDNECMDVPQGSILAAGDNIDISNDIVSLISSPALKGTPTAPTNDTASTSNTQIATTEFVQNAITRRLPKALEKKGTVANFTLASGSAVLKDCFTASATGTLFVTAFAQFAANANGSRSFSIYVGGGGTGSGSIVPAANGVSLGMSAAAIARVNAGSKVQLRFLQSSGSNIAISGINYQAYLIKD